MKGIFGIVALAAILGWVGCGANPPVDLGGKFKITTPTPPTVPDAPSDLTAQVLGGTHASLAWKDNSANETGFGVYWRKGGVGDFTITLYANADQTAITVSNLASASSYEFYVVSFNVIGASAPSNTVAVTTP